MLLKLHAVVAFVGVVAAIATSDRQALETWTREQGKSCYAGHGATELDSSPVGDFSVADCEAQCDKLADCTGITIQAGSTKGNCYRRKDISIAACVSGPGFDTWLKGSAPSPSPPAPLFPGRCGVAVTDVEAANIASRGWLDDYQGSIGFWYNWNDKSSTEIRAGGAVVPFLPMWWGSQVWSGHPEQDSWCSNAGYSPIPAESGQTSVAFAWNEPLGGAGCKWSMGACSGGDYSGADGAKRSAENYMGCATGAKAANRIVSTPCLNNIDPDWFRTWHKSRTPAFIETQPLTVCCSHIYASQYNGAAWDSCDLHAMTNMDKLPGQLQGLVDDGTCDYHFIQEIGIGGCKTADQSVSELLIQNLGNAVRNIPSVYLGWFANSQGDGGTARTTTWLFEENAATIGNAYKTMCSSLETSKKTILV